MTRRVRNGWGVGLIAALSCSGSSVEGPPLSDSLALGGLVLTNAAGEPQPLADYRRDEAGVLVVRVMTSWCGPCGWHAEHTRALVPDSQVPVRVIDVLLAGPDNTAPSTEDVERWQARSGEVATVLTDSDQQLERLLPARAALPLVAVLDAHTLRAHHDVLPDAASGWLSAPGPALLRDTIAALQAALVGRPAPLRTADTLHDDRFSDDVWDAIRSLQLPAAAPPDSSNRYADDPAAITFGERLFFAGELTPSERSVSCASCHMPELAFQDGKDQPPEGVGVGSRNVPTIVLAPDQRWQFWDGRADSAWAQAVVPFEDPNEQASSRLFVAHAIARYYAAEYEAIFGPLPPLAAADRFPAEGKPGDPAWDAMTEADRDAVTRVLVNVGKAIAAYERSLRPLPTALERYVAGDLAALSDEDKAGLAAFFSAGCAQCHHGPRFSDDAFHALRFPTGRPDRSADPGRVAGLAALSGSEFRRESAFSDDPTSARALTDSEPHLTGAFKTPGLRGVAFTLPYGHGGSFGGLASVLEAHRTPIVSDDSTLAVGERERWLVDFDPVLIPRLIRFLKLLRIELPERQ